MTCCCLQIRCCVVSIRIYSRHVLSRNILCFNHVCFQDILPASLGHQTQYVVVHRPLLSCRTSCRRRTDLRYHLRVLHHLLNNSVASVLAKLRQTSRPIPISLIQAAKQLKCPIILSILKRIICSLRCVLLKIIESLNYVVSISLILVQWFLLAIGKLRFPCYIITYIIYVHNERWR